MFCSIRTSTNPRKPFTSEPPTTNGREQSHAGGRAQRLHQHGRCLERGAERWRRPEYVAAANSDSLVIVDVGTDPSNPTLVGVLKDSTNMDGAWSVVLNVGTGLAYVAASASDSLAVVNVGTDPSSPTLLGVLKDSTNMDGAYLAYVVASVSDSLAIVNIKGVTWCAQDFLVSTNRHNVTSWF